jgi:hypothetical protein
MKLFQICASLDVDLSRAQCTGRAPKRSEAREPVTHIPSNDRSSSQFVAKENVTLYNHFKLGLTANARHETLTLVMDEITVENAQILLILIYTDIVDDNTRRASTLLGMVAKYVEYLGLADEKPCRSRQAWVFGHYRGALDSVDWIEEEERRKVF